MEVVSASAMNRAAVFELSYIIVLFFDDEVDACLRKLSVAKKEYLGLSEIRSMKACGGGNEDFKYKIDNF